MGAAAVRPIKVEVRIEVDGCRVSAADLARLEAAAAKFARDLLQIWTETGHGQVVATVRDGRVQVEGPNVSELI